MMKNLRLSGDFFSYPQAKLAYGKKLYTIGMIRYRLPVGFFAIDCAVLLLCH